MGKQETFSLPSSLPSLTCKFLFLCAKKIISFSRPLKKTYKKNCTEGPCVVLCGIKTANTGKEPFQKALRSILDYCGRKPCQSPKKDFFLKKKSFLFVEIIYKNQRSILYTCFLVVHKRGNLWRSCGFLYYSVIYINVCIQSNRMTYYSISLPSKT